MDKTYLKERFGVLLDSNNMAEVLKMHPATVRLMCQEGKIPAVRIGGRWRIPADKFAEFLECGGDE